MSVISARIDDQTKLEAEKIANSIGLSLSAAINVFLNRFVAEQGFPFKVTVPKKETTLFERSELELQVKDSIKNRHAVPVTIPSSFIDPSDKEIKYTKQKGMRTMPKLLVFAGPNGSGKSTITSGISIFGEYVNADLIKKHFYSTQY